MNSLNKRAAQPIASAPDQNQQSKKKKKINPKKSKKSIEQEFESDEDIDYNKYFKPNTIAPAGSTRNKQNTENQITSNDCADKTAEFIEKTPRQQSGLTNQELTTIVSEMTSITHLPLKTVREVEELETELEKSPDFLKFFVSLDIVFVIQHFF